MFHFINHSTIGLPDQQHRVKSQLFSNLNLNLKLFSSTTSDRIGFSTTNLLTLVVFQTIITQEMPRSNNSSSALSDYIIILIIISAFVILESVLIERILRSAAIEYRPIPKWIFIINWVPTLLQPQVPHGLANVIMKKKTTFSKKIIVDEEDDSYDSNSHIYENPSRKHHRQVGLKKIKFEFFF